MLLAFSPCPNDTFIFDALVNGRLPASAYAFNVRLADIQELNALAAQGEPDVCKVSCFALVSLLDQYALLRSGGALGRNCGPLLVANRPLSPADLPHCRIAVPGLDTTANFLLDFFAPDAQNRSVVLFSDIMPAVARGDYDLGVIIHESRFVYPSYGLTLVQDLGQFWENQTGLPIPLGCLVAKRSLGTETINQIDALVRQSVEYAFAHPLASRPYVCAHANEMDETVMQSHINLYVNDYSIDRGEEGDRAIRFLLDAIQNKKR